MIGMLLVLLAVVVEAALVELITSSTRRVITMVVGRINEIDG